MGGLAELNKPADPAAPAVRAHALVAGGSAFWEEKRTIGWPQRL